jgi:tetratricopeptide (TPR) repeat protein
VGPASLLLLVALALPPGAAAQEQEYESPAAKTLTVTSASVEAVEQFRAGMWELDNLDAPAATVHFEKALQIDPEFGAARVMHAANAPGIALPERLEGIAVGMIDMSRGTTVEQLLALAMREAANGNQESAATLITAATELAPDAPHLAYRRAVWSGGGIEAMKKVLKKHPDFAPAYNIMAYNLYNEGLETEAVEAVTKYVELAPDHPNPYDSYAEIMQWMGNLDEAMAHYQKAVELRPSFDEGYYGIAEVHWLKGEEKEARAAIEMGMEQAPTEIGRINAKRAVANTYVMEGKRKEAERLYTEVAAEAEAAGNKSFAALAYQQAAGANALLGNGEQVPAHLARAAELGAEGTPGQYVFAAYSFTQTGDLEAAGTAARQLAESAPDGWETAVHATNASLMLAEGNAEAAMEELEMGDKTAPSVRLLKARCYKAMKQGDKAEEIRDDLLSDPTLSLFNAGAAFARAEAKKM